MADLFLLSEAQMRRIERYFPLSHGIARVDDRRVISGIVFVIRNGSALARCTKRLDDQTTTAASVHRGRGFDGASIGCPGARRVVDGR